MLDGGKGSSPRPFSVDKETFAENYNRVFRRENLLSVTYEEEEAWQQLEKTMNDKVEQTKQGTCGCGRSPTGNCCGWHALTEEDYNYRKELYETGKVDLYGKEIK